MGSRQIPFAPETQHTRQLNIQANQTRQNQHNSNDYKSYEKIFNKQEVYKEVLDIYSLLPHQLEKTL